MSYGSFSETVGYSYGCYTYTESGRRYKIHVFKTNPRTMGVAGAVYSTRKKLSEMNPSTAVCEPSALLAKTNANYLDAGGGNSFYGIFYAGGIFSYNGRVDIDPNDRVLSDELYDENYYRACPALCINTVTRAATIRWPNYYGGTNCLTPKQLTEQYDVIISGQHCMVHAGKSVFESICYSYEGITIANWSNLSDKYNHHNEALGGYNGDDMRARTFFGHSADGACYLVCVEGDADATGGAGTSGMNLKTGARLMCDLGCDFAINMDGGRPTQMRVASEGGAVYSREPVDSYKIGSAICAYSK